VPRAGRVVRVARVAPVAADAAGRAGAVVGGPVATGVVDPAVPAVPVAVRARAAKVVTGVGAEVRATSGRARGAISSRT
jgi:hypothetical protein